MKKTSKMVLMLCLILSAAFSYAHGAARTGIPKNEKGKDVPITVIAKVTHGDGNRSESILASIDGHVLSVVFTEDLGQVAIDISTAAGTTVDYNSIHTPNGVNFYIPNTGSYIVTFTLPNNDVYYGEFEVTD